jgi:hypothetical protein
MEADFIQHKVSKQKVGTNKVEVSVDDLIALTAVRKWVQGGYDGDGGSKSGWVQFRIQFLW